MPSMSLDERPSLQDVANLSRFLMPMSEDPGLSLDQDSFPTYDQFLNFEDIFEASEHDNWLLFNETAHHGQSGLLSKYSNEASNRNKSALELFGPTDAVPDRLPELPQLDTSGLDPLDHQLNDLPIFGGMNPTAWFAAEQASDICNDNPSKRPRPQSSNTSNISSSEHGQLQPQKKVRSVRFNRSQHEILEAWLLRNVSNPYPQEPAKVALASSTGLSIRQVEACFSRTRQRKLMRAEDSGLLHQSTRHDAENSFSGTTADIQKATKVNQSGIFHLPNSVLGHLSDYHRYMEREKHVSDVPRNHNTWWQPWKTQGLARSLRYEELRPQERSHRRSRSCASVVVGSRTKSSGTPRINHIFGDQEESASLDAKQSSLEVAPATREVSPMSDVQGPASWNVPSTNKLELPLSDGHGLEDWDIEQWLQTLPEKDYAYDQTDPEAVRISQHDGDPDKIPSTADSRGDIRSKNDDGDIRKLLQGDAEADETMAPSVRRSTRYVCSFLPCNMSFSTPAYLSQHEKYHRGGMLWSCSCGHSVYNRDDFVDHFKRNCRRQCESFSTSSRYSKLMLSKLDVTDRRNERKKQDENVSECDFSCSRAVSACNYASFGPRRGRRAVFQEPSRMDTMRDEFDDGSTPQKDTMKTRYQCTFCQDAFSTRYTWRRHEESVHAPQKLWICGPPTIDDKYYAQGTKGIRCPICDEAALPQPLCQHEFETCWKKPERERTFFRKDNLAQHIRLVHCGREPNDPLNLSSWNRDVPPGTYDLLCHFCYHPNESWDERAKHVPNHFEEGLDMDHWSRFDSIPRHETLADHEIDRPAPMEISSVTAPFDVSAYECPYDGCTL